MRAIRSAVSRSTSTALLPWEPRAWEGQRSNKLRTIRSEPDQNRVKTGSEPGQNRLTAASLVLNSFSRCSRYCSISAWASSLACFRRRFFPAHRTEPSEPGSGSEPEPQPSSFKPTNSFIFPQNPRRSRKTRSGLWFRPSRTGSEGCEPEEIFKQTS